MRHLERLAIVAGPATFYGKVPFGLRAEMRLTRGAPATVSRSSVSLRLARFEGTHDTPNFTRDTAGLH